MNKYYQTTLRLWKLLKPFHKYFYLQLFLIVIMQLMTIFLTVLLAKSINEITLKTFDWAAYFVLIYFVLSYAKTYVSYYKEQNAINKIDLSISQYLQEYSFKNVFRLNASQYVEDHSAIKLQVIARGEEAIQSIVTTIFLTILPTVTQVTFSVIAIAWYSWPVALICLFSLIIVTAWTNWYTNFQRPLLRTNINMWDDQRKIRTEGFQHLSLIKTSGVETNYLKSYLESRESLLNHTIMVRQFSNTHNTRRWNFFSFTNAISRLLLVYYAYLGKIAIGDIYAVWTWISEANANIFNVINAMRTIPLNFVELEKYLNIVDKKPEFEEEGNKKFSNGDIIFENVSFKYPKADAPVLSNLNITIPENKKIAFVGFSGSGKSTIIKLLLRIYDWDAGDIKIGDKSLRSLDAKTLRHKIGYVEQHVDLFDTTIKENILFGIADQEHNKISNEDLNRIAHTARIDQFYHRLGTQGLDTTIGERGVKLSGGERQRIGIARALAKNPDILIFDEATASLDTENEKYIQEAIDASSEGRTTIVVAHRLSTIQNSDIIFVMDKGVIVGQGKHEFLKETNPEYQRLIHAQNK